MKSAGYKTFFAGKWYLGGEGVYPEDHGFDINIGGIEQVHQETVSFHHRTTQNYLIRKKAKI